MTAVSFNKVTALPGTPGNSAIYYIASATAGVVDEIVTSTTGTTRQVAPVGSVAPPLTTAVTSAAGSSDIRARADHSHGLAAIPATTTATTQAVGNDSTLVATTAYVLANKATTVAPLISGASGSVGTSTLFAKADHQHYMPSSFVLPDGVTATTQAAADNTTKVATTAFVTAAVAASGATWTTEAW